MARSLIDRWTSGGQGLGIGLIAYSVNVSHARALRSVTELIEDYARARQTFADLGVSPDPEGIAALRAAAHNFNSLGSEREYETEVQMADGPMHYWIMRTRVARHRGAVIQSLVRRRGELIPVSKPI